MRRNAALKIARHAVSPPAGRGTSWQIYGPARADRLDGLRTYITATSFRQARAQRAEWIAALALVCMGWAWEKAFTAVDFVVTSDAISAEHGAAAIVAAALSIALPRTVGADRPGERTSTPSKLGSVNAVKADGEDERVRAVKRATSAGDGRRSRGSSVSTSFWADWRGRWLAGHGNPALRSRPNRS